MSEPNPEFRTRATFGDLERAIEAAKDRGWVHLNRICKGRDVRFPSGKAPASTQGCGERALIYHAKTDATLCVFCDAAHRMPKVVGS
jgi:hypothetical protein